MLAATSTPVADELDQSLFATTVRRDGSRQVDLQPAPAVLLRRRPRTGRDKVSGRLRVRRWVVCRRSARHQDHEDLTGVDLSAVRGARAQAKYVALRSRRR